MRVEIPSTNLFKPLQRSVEPERKDEVTFAITHLADLQPIITDEYECVSILLDGPRLPRLVLLVELCGRHHRAVEMLC